MTFRVRHPQLDWGSFKMKLKFDFLLRIFTLKLLKAMKESFVYILCNKNKTTYYIGVTSNLKERIENHKQGKGSIFTKKYNITELLYYEIFTSINDAIFREKQLKKWNRNWKLELIKTKNPDLIDLFPLL